MAIRAQNLSEAALTQYLVNILDALEKVKLSVLPFVIWSSILFLGESCTRRATQRQGGTAGILQDVHVQGMGARLLWVVRARFCQFVFVSPRLPIYFSSSEYNFFLYWRSGLQVCGRCGPWRKGHQEDGAWLPARLRVSRGVLVLRAHSGGRMLRV
jgi:hypothetical protein